MRILYPIALLFLILSSCSPTPEKKEDIRPNILWIVADDLGTDLNCYGEKAVYTPNLDRLAQEGVLYENHFTVTAVCSPSRSAFITGMYPTSINCHQHRTQYKDSLPAPIRPLPLLFREAGYYVSNASEKNFDKFGKTDYNFIHKNEQLYDGPNWRGRAEGQPFFAQVQIFYPHRPFVKDPDHPVDPNAVRIPPYYPDHPITRKDWALYLETVQAVDKAVGEVIKKLEEDSLLENTIVFFFGDQGRPHVRAKQFMYDGGTRTPLIVRWPNGKNADTQTDRLVSNIDISAASLQLAGINIPDWMQGQDFLSPDSPKRDYVFTVRDRRDETVDRIRAVRSKDFKYIRNFYPERPWSQFNAYKKYRYPVLTLMEIMHKKGSLTPEQDRFFDSSRPEEELYDLKQDPFEVNNLAKDPEYAEQLTAMRKALEDWLVTADKGSYPEDPKEIQYAEELMIDRFKKNMEREGLTPEISNEDYIKWWEQHLGVKLAE